MPTLNTKCVYILGAAFQKPSQGSFQVLFFLCLVLLPWFLAGQNLVPNGGFEDVVTCPANLPENGIVATEPWYVVGEPRTVTPDLFHANCPISAQRAAASQFWGKQFLPYEGKGFMGLGCAVFSNGVYVSEGAAVPLSEPLKAGKAYYFEMHVRNKGIDRVDNPDAKSCNTTPGKMLGVYLSDDSIRQEREMSNNQIVNTFTNSRLQLADSGKSINGFQLTDWYRFSDCFLASGGESHLGVIGPLGTFHSVSFPCNNLSQQPGFFHQSYYDIDGVTLLEMPVSLRADAVICADEGSAVRLRPMVPMPVFDKATFIWKDGSTDSVRVIKKEGVYQVDVVMPCTTVPLEIHVQPTDCATRLYSPSAFSPNGDGTNDEFRPLFHAYWNLLFFQLTIYDRWGRSVFTTNDQSANWNGENELEGVYVWSVVYQLQDDRRSGMKIQSGTVTLMR